MICSFISFKGGVGKSTLSQNVAICLAYNDYKVGIIDADETRASSEWSMVREKSGLTPKIPVLELNEDRGFMKAVRNYYQENDFDVLIIDCPPSVSKIAEKIIGISHVVFFPMTPSGGSDLWVTRTIVDLYLEHIEEYQKKVPAYFIINRFDSRVNLHNAYMDVLKSYDEEYKIGTLKSKLHNRIAYGESNAYGKGVYEYNNLQAKKEIISLTNEILTISENL